MPQKLEIEALSHLYESLENGEKILVFGTAKENASRTNSEINAFLGELLLFLGFISLIFIVIICLSFMETKVINFYWGISAIVAIVFLMLRAAYKQIGDSEKTQKTAFYALTSLRLMSIDKSGNVRTLRLRKDVTEIRIDKARLTLQIQEKHQVVNAETGLVKPGKVTNIRVEELLELPNIIGGHGLPQFDASD